MLRPYQFKVPGSDELLPVPLLECVENARKFLHEI